MPSRLRLLLALVSSALLASSVATTAAAETRADATYAAIQGTVVDEVGAPLPGVSLVLRHGDARYGVTTDADGAYRLSGLDGGVWVVDFSDRYLPAPEQVTITDGAVASVVPLVAHPGATVSGRVLVAGGLPDGVVAYASLTVPGSPVERSATAAADGTWTTTGIPPGRTTVTLASGASESVTRTLDVAAGATTASTGTVTLRRTYDITGQVQLPAPIGPHDSLSTWRADLHLATSSGSPTGTTLRWVPMTLGAGDQWASYGFELVPTGRYVVRVVETYRGTSRVALQKVVTLTDRSVSLGAPMISVGAPISGTAYDGGMTVLHEGDVTAFDVPCTGATPALGWGIGGTVHRDGTFSVPTLRGHCYALGTAAPGFSFKWNELVGDLLHVRAGTAHVHAHPRLFSWITSSRAPHPYGTRSLLVHLVPVDRAPHADGGTVTLRAGGRTIGRATVSHGGATVRLNTVLAPGKHTISATYSGTTTFVSTSGHLEVTIGKVRSRASVGVARATSQGATVTVRVASRLQPAHRLVVECDGHHRVTATAHREGTLWIATARLHHVGTGHHVLTLYRAGDSRTWELESSHRVTVSTTRSSRWTATV